MPTPAWPILASGPGAGERYFFIPQLAVLACLVWGSTVPRISAVRVGATALIAVSVVVAISSHWSYPRFASIGFPQKAAAFERAPRGTIGVFVLNPVSFWTMTLTKH